MTDILVKNARIVDGTEDRAKDAIDIRLADGPVQELGASLSAPDTTTVIDDNVALPTIFKGVTWFISMDVLTLVLLVAFPAITLWLPEMIYG